MENNSTTPQTNAESPKQAEFRPVWRAYIVFWVAAVMFALGPFINPEAPIKPRQGLPIAVACVVVAVAARMTTRYRLTDTTIEAFRTLPGVGGHDVVQIADIVRVDVRRGIIHRLLNIARVHLLTSLDAPPALRMTGVTKPLEFKELLMSRGASDDGATGMWR